MPSPPNLTRVYQAVSGGFIGFFDEPPGANAPGRTLAEVRESLDEVIELVLDASRRFAATKTPETCRDPDIPAP